MTTRRIQPPPDSPPSLLVDPGRVLPPIHMQAARGEACCRGAYGETSASGRLTVRKNAQGTKRSRDEDDAAARKPEMKLVVPQMLKRQVVNDWETA
ncbi:hypothetical protein D9611_009004 [Ephemerocybe angulata]|uniref:Uncharacterized protein n=1 Tax=Ephemerocybe angulata TaxID=980116 RepID=A0A8H5C0N9_9AGAR|nr:hypothetical protein D9611_009004 [Tulosesus angulatus]